MCLSLASIVHESGHMPPERVAGHSDYVASLAKLPRIPNFFFFGLCRVARGDDGRSSDDSHVLPLRHFTMGAGYNPGVAETVSGGRGVSQ